MENHRLCYKQFLFLPGSGLTANSPRSKAAQSSVAVSVARSDMMKIGAVSTDEVKQDFVTLNIMEYSVAKKSWSMIPGFSTFLIERDSFGSGTFRSAFRAKQLGKAIEGTLFVAKRFRDSALGIVTEKGKLSKEDAMKKHIQMHMYARNYIKLLKSEAPTEYGQHFSMGKAYLATTTKGEPLFLEPMINSEGKFDKYVNNNGVLYPVLGQNEEERERQAKAETLCHYSYCRSGKHSMVIDIQGCGYSITDPEVATMQHTDASDNKLFCGGNLRSKAINAFMMNHECSEYCRMLKLSDSF